MTHHIRYFDAHNHLQDAWLAPWCEQAIRQLDALPIAGAVVNGTCESDWADVAELAKRKSWVRPSFGLHPWHVGNRTGDWEEQLHGWLDRTPRAVIGEIGLDRWILEGAKPDDVRLKDLRRAAIEDQRVVFEKQLATAAERNLPVTIHCLGAWGILQDVLTDNSLPDCGFLLHAYGGSTEQAKWFVQRGAYFSFSGYFLGDNRFRAQEVFRSLPVDRLLMETDAPSMPLPQKWRTYKLPPGPDGVTLNHPGNIEAVYAGFAALRGIALEELSEIVAENYTRLFGV